MEPHIESNIIKTEPNELEKDPLALDNHFDNGNIDIKADPIDNDNVDIKSEVDDSFICENDLIVSDVDENSEIDIKIEAEDTVITYGDCLIDTNNVTCKKESDSEVDDYIANKRKFYLLDDIDESITPNMDEIRKFCRSGHEKIIAQREKIRGLQLQKLHLTEKLHAIQDSMRRTLEKLS